MATEREKDPQTKKQVNINDLPETADNAADFETQDTDQVKGGMISKAGATEDEAP
jgi:hypothetical protein